MKKVTQAVISAFLNNKNKSQGNTSTDGETLFLHGNPIARHTKSGGIEISNAGWSTPTTKERLNGVLDLSGSTLGIWQHKNQWYIGDGVSEPKEFPSCQWYAI